MGHVEAQRSKCGFSNRNASLLVSLPDNVHRTSTEIDVLEIQAAKFRNPETGAVQQLEHRSVPRSDRVVVRRQLAQLRGVGRLEHARKGPVEFWGEEVGGGIRLDEVVKDRPAEHRSDGAGLASNGPARVSPLREVGDVASQPAPVYAGEVRDPGASEPLRKPPEVRSVRRLRVRRQVALRSHGAQKSLGGVADRIAPGGIILLRLSCGHLRAKG